MALGDCSRVPKEVFDETLMVYINLLRGGRYKLNKRIAMNQEYESSKDENNETEIELNSHW